MKTSVNGTTIPSSKTLVVTTDKLSALSATTSAELAGVISDETGSGSLVFGTSPTFTTNLTSPLLIGGTAVSSTLILKSTSGVGSSDAIIFQVGNNGATEAGRFNTSGFLGINNASPGYQLDLSTATNGTVFRAGSTSGATINVFNGEGHFTSGATLSTGGSWTARNGAGSGTAADINLSAGVITFNRATGLTSGNTFSYTTSMTISTAGELGIGITPSSRNNCLLQLSNGIGFPTTQVASSDVNVLDDYEEGTWTPALGSPGTVTYTTQLGTYTKIGNRVFIQGKLTINAIGTGNGNGIAGLPFALNAAQPVASFPITLWSSLAASYVNIGLIGVGSASTADLVGATAATATTGVVTALTSGSSILFQGHYII